MIFYFSRHLEELFVYFEKIFNQSTFFEFHFKLFVYLNIPNILSLTLHSITIKPVLYFIINFQNFEGLKAFL